jgi:hypothetical protein
MDDEERRRLDRLDYSTDSAERPYGAPDHDQRSPREHDGRAPNRTSFNAGEMPDETVERDGKVYDKWVWLARLNENAHTPLKTTRKRQAERRRDVEILVQSTNEWAAEQGDDHVVNVRRVFTLLDALVDGADEDYRFGPNNPVEVAVLAALSLAANEEQWMIRQTDLFDEFMSTYVPDDSAADRGDIMRMRQRIRDALSTVDDKD